jgi:hypothetical protein
LSFGLFGVRFARAQSWNWLSSSGFALNCCVSGLSNSAISGRANSTLSKGSAAQSAKRSDAAGAQRFAGLVYNYFVDSFGSNSTNFLVYNY